MSFYLIGVHGDPASQPASAFDRLGSTAASIPDVQLVHAWHPPQPEFEYALVEAPNPTTVSELVESVGLTLEAGRVIGESPSFVWERASVGDVEAKLRGEAPAHFPNLPEEEEYCRRCRDWHPPGQHDK